MRPATSSGTPEIDEASIVDYCRQWIDAGVQVLGGCCGLTVSHIRAIRGLLDEIEDCG